MSPTARECSGEKPAEALLIVQAFIRDAIDLHVWDEVPERFHEIIRSGYLVLS